MTRVALKVDLTPLKNEACEIIDAQAEVERAKYVTAGALQAMTYQAKNAEAVDFLNGGTGPFPLLLAESTALGISLSELAITVNNMAKQWIQISSVIEAKRIGAKAAIKNATTPAAIKAVMVDWQING